jgi:hypothetical protein
LKAPKKWRTQRGSSFPGRKRRGHALDFEGIVAGQEAEKQDKMAKKEGKLSMNWPREPLSLHQAAHLASMVSICIKHRLLHHFCV